jgi:hydroxypyruvate reductase
VSSNPEALLNKLWRAAIQAAQPAACLPGHWPQSPPGRLVVLACGKAARPMAAAAAAHYGAGIQGLVIEPAEAGTAAEAIAGFRYVRASHPVPDERSVAAAQAALQLAAGLGSNDLLLVLLSGGGSSLMSLPAADVTLEEKQSLTRQLLSCGAAIHEINCVRKQLSRIKGGRLAQACGAPVVTLAISDVPGDDPGLIASGPTVADNTNPGEARAILSRYRIRLTSAVDRALLSAAAERPARADPARRDVCRIVASGMTALESAAACCRDFGVEPLILGDELEGEASELAERQAGMAIDMERSGKTGCLLSGGETTVTLRGSPGRGGRNTEYALALALALRERPGIWALAADTDGIDGIGGHSGAIVDPLTLGRARQAGLDAGAFLQRHDSASFFEAVGGLLVEGPTGTNVNDFRAILVNA